MILPVFEKIIEKQINNEVFTGEGDPLPTMGKPGDYYFDRQNGKLYGPKTSEGWGTPTSVTTPNSQLNQKPAAKVLTGTTPPTAAQGNIGDWYVDTQAKKFYGPKTAEGWGQPATPKDDKGQNPQPIPEPTPTPKPTPNETTIDPSYYELSEDGRILKKWKYAYGDLDIDIDMSTEKKLRYITEIAPRAFEGTRIRRVILPNGLETIGEYAFSNSQLTSVTIPDSVTDIGQKAFMSNRLNKIVIGKGVRIIARETFADNELTDIIIPDNIEYIGEKAFFGNKLTNVKIGNRVETIMNEAFSGDIMSGHMYKENRNQLTSVFISNSVKYIEDRAFYNNQLTSVTIPNSVASIEVGPFSNNPLTSVTFEGRTPPYGFLDVFYSFGDFYKRIHTLKVIYVPTGSVAAYKNAVEEESLKDKIRAKE